MTHRRFVFAYTLLVFGLVPGALLQPAAAQEASATGEEEKPDPELNAAFLAVRQGNLKKALDELEKLKPKHPEYAEPRTLLAQLLMLANRPGPGRLELERAVVDDPLAPEPYVMFAEMSLRDGRVTDASSVLNKALEVANGFQGNADRKKTALTRVQAGQARVAELRGHWQQAFEHLTAWQKLDPDNAFVHQRLGQVLFQLKKYKEALTELQLATKAEKRLLPAEVMMGQLYEGIGDHKTASQYMSQAAKRSPDDLRTRLAVATWALQTNQIAKAKAEAEAAAKVEPDSVDTNLLRGAIARLEKKPAEAERFFQAAHLKSPTNFAASNNLALVLADQPESTKQQAALEFAALNAQKNSNSPDAFATLAWVLYRLERYNEAEKAMERTLSSGNLNPDSAFYFGTLLERRGKLDDARTVLEKALETPQAFVYRNEATELLAKLKKEEAEAAKEPAGKDAPPPKKPTTPASTAPANPKK